jgi:4-hydroxy-tetrahydrodipicolinate synthase
VLLERRAAYGTGVVLSVADHATEVAVRHARLAVERGADVVNVLLPSFLGPEPVALRHHLAEVLAAVAPTPVVLQYARRSLARGSTPTPSAR